MKAVCVCLLLYAAAPAIAQEEAPALDPDTEVARRHFERGTVLYDQYKYEDAIAEFKAANEAKPFVDFDYNIARCYDRLGDWARALDYYQRYLAGAGDLAAAAEVRERVAALKERISRLIVPAAPPARPLRLAALILAGVTVASFAAGSGFYGWAAADFPSRRSYCASLPRNCVPSELSDLEARAKAGYALWGVSGALAAVDIVLFVVDAIRQRRRQASISPAHGWLASGRF